MATWGLLDDKEENELHKSRLLNVEEKPFKRITKRLNTLHTLAIVHARQAPTPPPETASSTAPTDGTQQASPSGESASPTPATDALLSTDLAQLKEDITLDFAAFDSSIARLQFLLTANERERDRYAAERQRIVAASQAVRNNTAQLRQQLEQARATLAQRRKFDELADAITNNPALKPRAEQAENLRKLEEEIAELEAEAEQYSVTWNERREQFARIMDESMRLRRLIRDEKEEVDRREGMDDDQGETGGSAEGGETTAGQTPRPSGAVSGNATPRPESGVPAPKSVADSGDVGTPQPVSTTGCRTPARESSVPSAAAPEGQSFLKPPTGAGASFSQAGSTAGSREVSTEREVEAEQGEVEESEDVEMIEVKDDQSEPDSPLTPPSADDAPQIVVDTQPDTMDTT